MSALRGNNLEKDQWAGETAAVLCSGPSLTPEDVKRVRGLKVIVTNTTFRLAPWADVLFGFDTAWWSQHIEEVREVFSGELYGAHSSCTRHRVKQIMSRSYGNSGATAIGLAAKFGASKIILLGADCSVKQGSHWHGDHPQPLRNCASVSKWPSQYRAAGDYAKARGAKVINCSRATALTCFDRMSLEEALDAEHV